MDDVVLEAERYERAEAGVGEVGLEGEERGQGHAVFVGTPSLRGLRGGIREVRTGSGWL